MTAPERHEQEARAKALRESGRPAPAPTLDPEVAALLNDAQLRQVVDLLKPQGSA